MSAVGMRREVSPSLLLFSTTPLGYKVYPNCGAGEDSWESLGQQGDKGVNPKGNQPWIFIGKTDAEAKAPILWPPDVKSQLTGKDPDAGKDWRQEEKGMTEDEMVGWHHQLNGHEFEQTLGDSERQGGLACCSSWGHKGLATTEQLNNKQGYKDQLSVYILQKYWTS